MRARLPVLAAFLIAGAATPAAAAPDELLVGEVIAAESRWTAGHRIVTEAVVRRTDGAEVRVRQSGGTVDGIGMMVLHGPPVLRPGQRLRAHVALRPASSPPVFELRRPLAFVRPETDSGTPLYWAASCIYVASDSAGSEQIAGDVEFAVIDEVLARWRADTQGCSYLTFADGGRVAGEVGYDGVNLIKFREQTWCRPATEDEPEECYDGGAAALTSFFYVNDEDSDRDGEILDGDIEFNGVNFAIAANGQSLGSVPCQSDLANTLTHEVGHLMGLHHTCWDGGNPHPLDSTGAPLRSCFPAATLPPEISEATMYNYQSCGETKKASPEPDDVAGVCAIYPLADDPGECRRADLGGDGGCCTVTPAGRRRDLGGPGAAALALAALAMLAGLARRRRSRLR